VGRGRGPAQGVPPVALGGLDGVGAIACEVQVGRGLAPSGSRAAGARTQVMRMDDQIVQRGSSVDAGECRGAASSIKGCREVSRLVEAIAFGLPVLPVLPVKSRAPRCFILPAFGFVADPIGLVNGGQPSQVAETTDPRSHPDDPDGPRGSKE
jgi:hypothetical protein